MGSDPRDSLTRKQERPVAIVPIDLGDGAAFDPSIFPAEYYAEDNNLDKGVVLIMATLKEMEKIRDLGINLDKNGNFIFNTRLELEDLRVKQAKLEDEPKTFNPFKVFRNYRAARLLHEGSKSLYLKTKRTSERIHREAKIQVVPRTQMRRVQGAIPQGVKVGGISILLPDGFNENVERTIGDARDTIANTEVNPFQDNSFVPQLGDDEQEITLANTDSLLSQESAQDDEEDGGDRPTVAFSDPRLPPPTSLKTGNITVIVGSHVEGLTSISRSRNSGGATIIQEPAS